MVWFQCEDCGENLKKPKLPNHFRICSAGKLSCIDCGETFNQQTVQGHTQCITEAEKYGPKGQAKSPHCAQSKPSKPKQDVDFDIHVGLSSRPPWFCSLCNTKTTSQQTLLSHADGKKHRAKARAFHAAQKPPSQQDGSVQNKDNADDTTTIKVDDGKCINKQEDKMSDKQSCALIAEVETDSLPSKRRKLDAPDVVDAGYNMDNHPADLSNGEVVQAEKVTYSQINTKKNKCDADKNGLAEEAPKKKIKWKKLATSILKSDSDGVMKLKKLEKHVRRTLKGSGISVNEAELHEKLIDKVSSSSRFVIENKHIRLVAKAGSA